MSNNPYTTIVITETHCKAAGDRWRVEECSDKLIVFGSLDKNGHVTESSAFVWLERVDDRWAESYRSATAPQSEALIAFVTKHGLPPEQETP